MDLQLLVPVKKNSQFLLSARPWMPHPIFNVLSMIHVLQPVAPPDCKPIQLQDQEEYWFWPGVYAPVEDLDHLWSLLFGIRTWSSEPLRILSASLGSKNIFFCFYLGFLYRFNYIYDYIEKMHIFVTQCVHVSKEVVFFRIVHSKGVFCPFFGGCFSTLNCIKAALKS